MESKIQIDIDINRQENIRIKWKNSEDVRDTLVNMFLHTSMPGFNDSHEICIKDGYCRISLLSQEPDGSWSAEIVPIHPIEMQKHIYLIEENAGKFQTEGEKRKTKLYMIDEWAVNNLKPDLYNAFKNELMRIGQ